MNIVKYCLSAVFLVNSAHYSVPCEQCTCEEWPMAACSVPCTTAAGPGNGLAVFCPGAAVQCTAQCSMHGSVHCVLCTVYCALFTVHCSL